MAYEEVKLLLRLIFPRSPENGWGGLLGYFFGTHPLTAWVGEGLVTKFLAFRVRLRSILGTLCSAQK